MILKDFLLTHLFFKKQPTDRVIFYAIVSHIERINWQLIQDLYYWFFKTRKRIWILVGFTCVSPDKQNNNNNHLVTNGENM